VLQADGQWSPNGIAATLQTLRLQAKAFGLPRTELILEAGLTPERIDLQRLQVRLPQSVVRGRGSLTMVDQQLQFRIEIPRLQLDEFPITLPPDLPKQMQGTITVNGSLRAPRVEARLTYAGARIGADLEAQLQESSPLPGQAAHRIAQCRQAVANHGWEIQATLQFQGAVSPRSSAAPHSIWRWIAAILRWHRALRAVTEYPGWANAQPSGVACHQYASATQRQWHFVGRTGRG
jgi:hypothetical protein